MNIDKDFIIPKDRINNLICILNRVANVGSAVAGHLRSILSYLYMHDGPINLQGERLKASEPFLEPRQIVLVRWLQTRTNGSLRSKYGAKALLAARQQITNLLYGVFLMYALFISTISMGIQSIRSLGVSMRIVTI